MQRPALSARRLAGMAALACAAALMPVAALATTASPGAAAGSAVPARSSAGTWNLLPAAPVTTFPGFTVSVWTGREMIIHGGLATGPVSFAYRPATSTWTKLAGGPALLTLQSSDVAVWTGSEMLVLGLTNGAYDPATHAWRPVARGAGPLGGAVVGWTGRQVLSFGGVCCASFSNSGTSYTPATNTWQRLPAAPLHPRRGVMGAWDGTELVVAGGWYGHNGVLLNTFGDAAAYNPATRTWRKLAPMSVPGSGGTAVWDGTEVLFLGVAPGGAVTSPSAAGLAYNPATNRWRRLPAMPFAGTGFAAVWTGRQLLVWGGLTGTGTPPPHGEAYTPATNNWMALPASPLPGRADPLAVWTGRQMIVWGGSADGRSYTDGAAYTPGST